MLSINRHPKPGKKTNFSAVSDNQIYFILFYFFQSVTYQFRPKKGA